MLDLATFPANYFGNFYLVLVRVGAMLFSAPLIQGRSVPVTVKVGLSLLLTLLLLPINQGHFADVPFEWVPLTILTMQEMAVGILVGFIANLVVFVVQMGGQVLGLQMGFTLANVIDPLNSQQVSLLDQLYTILAGMTFLAIDGEHMLILSVQQTLDLVPLGTFHLTEPAMFQLITIVGGLFVAAVRLVLPIMATLLLADIALGLVARAAPQVNVFVVGMPLKIAVGFIMIAGTMPAVSSLTEAYFQSAFVDIANIMKLVS